jgi:hypothetical protein
MWKQESVNASAMTPEGRCVLDTAISEMEMEYFDQFYRGLLKKRLEDKLSLLKGLYLLRRGDLRSYVQYAALFQARYENLIPLKQRDLLLSFPSVNKEIYELMFSCANVYGEAGATAVGLTKEQVTEHLDRTEMFRIDLDSMLSDADTITPENRTMLSDYFASPLQGQERTFKFSIVILADHAMLSLLPHTERNSTIAIGQIRQYLERRFPKDFEENLIEFFAVGGGYLRNDGRQVVIGGRSIVFDPIFEDVAQPLSEMYLARFLTVKYQLTQQILQMEFPQYNFVINQSTGHLKM